MCVFMENAKKAHRKVSPKLNIYVRQTFVIKTLRGSFKAFKRYGNWTETVRSPSQMAFRVLTITRLKPKRGSPEQDLRGRESRPSLMGKPCCFETECNQRETEPSRNPTKKSSAAAKKSGGKTSPKNKEAQTRILRRLAFLRRWVEAKDLPPPCWSLMSEKSRGIRRSRANTSAATGCHAVP